MKLETLNYIHTVLVENEATASKARKLAREAAQKADDEDADNRAALWEVSRKTFESWRKASAALGEFEEHEW
jgi:hypothetical protein